MTAQPPQAYSKWKYDDNGKSWYFWLDDDDNELQIYTLDHLTWMGQFKTYNPTYCKENKECNRENLTPLRLVFSREGDTSVEKALTLTQGPGCELAVRYTTTERCTYENIC